ncbi:GNAT family N-acetyltransferase [Consotaella aegiceratis]|uniref:GNAT family N-acetyltransferase n=1 Tax=Consotaella aegiceratis TaxID=3097961 RepID=UPI002F4226AA
MLRALENVDLAAVFRILSCPITTRDVTWRKDSMDEAAAWLDRRMRCEAAHGYSMWAMEAETAEISGLCGFFSSPDGWLELGYVVFHEQQGRGLASEAANAAVAAAQAAGRRVFATIRQNNHASIRVAEKAGLQRTDERVAVRPDLLMFRSPGGETPRQKIPDG